MADIYDLNIAIQRLLKSENCYDGPIDGLLGPKSFDGVKKLITSYGINTDNWHYNRLKVGAEQALYKANKIQVGAIDGFEGPLLQQARDVYNALLTISFRDKKDELDKEVPPVPISVKTTITNQTQWPTQRQCMSYYGDPGSNQAICKVPYTMYLAWDLNSKVTQYQCHRLVKEPMERIWNRVLEHYGYDKIIDLRLHLWGGCLNVRRMRGGSAWSMHAWGIAVDMDPDHNQLRQNHKTATFAKPEYDKYWEIIYDEGAISLGKERDFDWMHFQFARL